MKKVLCIAVVALLAVSAVHAEESNAPGNLGVGYQGVFYGDLINAVSVRWAPAPLGGQIELGQGGALIEAPGASDIELDIIMIKGKLFVTLIERENSVFYAGASLGYYQIETKNLLAPSADLTGFSLAPLVGAEWRLQGLPELGINFEVSYELKSLEAEAGGTTVDVGLYGITVSTGIAYYF